MKIGLFDADSVSFIACYNKPNAEPKTWEQVKLDVDSCIISNLRLSGATHYIGALTCSKGFRYKVDENYKSNRKKLVPMPFIKESKQHMKDRWGFVTHDDLESDDIVVICKKAIPDSFIISPDKDLLNLCGRHFNPRLGKWIETTEEQANLFFACSLIKGDASDGISGLKGRGEAFFNKLEDKSLLGIMREYIIYHGEYKGIEEFAKNYKLLKMLDEYPDFVIPEIKEFKGNYEF